MAPGEAREGMEINGVAQPGPGLLAEGAAFDPAPDHPIEAGLERRVTAWMRLIPLSGPLII
jgi:hypothetical protein